MDIINLVSRINDLHKLKWFQKKIEEMEESKMDMEIKKPSYKDGIVEIREGVSFEQILQEQDYEPISYWKFRELAPTTVEQSITIYYDQSSP